jgi:pimeloyl-ACP methyl ester carboxylesterase
MLLLLLPVPQDLIDRFSFKKSTIMFLFLITARVLYKFVPHGAPATFRQPTDHFDPNNTNTFFQRYFVNLSFWRGEPNSPLIVYIGGEGSMTDSRWDSGTISVLANRSHAILFGLEHRFFGESHPFDRYNSKTLRFLTVSQALADLDSFIRAQRDAYSCHENCSVLVVGGSYSGSLSSWFRLYYPHVADFSWASSAPVNIKLEFPEYDEKVARDLLGLSEECYFQTKLILSGYHQGMVRNGNATAKELNMTFGFPLEMNRTSMLSILADVISYAVQYNEKYGYIGPYCQRIAENPSGAFAAYRDLFSKVTKSVSIEEMDPLLETCHDDAWDSPCSESRAWTWITCNELGWFGTSAGFQSPWVNLSYANATCRALFNISIGNISRVVNRYGGRAPGSSFVVFSQGTFDPWSTVGVSQYSEDTAQFLYKIDGAGHCSDMEIARKSSQELIDGRQNITERLLGWLTHECDSSCRHGNCFYGKCRCDNGWSEEWCDVQVVSSENFLWVGLTALMMPLLILLSVGGSAWWLVREVHEQRLLLSMATR